MEGAWWKKRRHSGGSGGVLLFLLGVFYCESFIVGFGLSADGLSDLDIDWSEPVVAVGLEAVDDREELVVKRSCDGAHLPIADQDAINRAEVRDFGCGSGEERFVADVEKLAGQSLLDDLDAKLAGQRDD